MSVVLVPGVDELGHDGLNRQFVRFTLSLNADGSHSDQNTNQRFQHGLSIGDLFRIIGVAVIGVVPTVRRGG